MSLRVVVNRCLFVVFGVIAYVDTHAAEYTAGEYRGRRILVLDGKIETNELREFEKALARAGPVEEIVLNSGGGSEMQGLAIGRAIRQRGLATRIPAGGACASACADIFLGGVARRVEKGGRYGIHMATIGRNSEVIRQVMARVDSARKNNNPDAIRELIFFIEQESAQSAARWAGYVLEMGASPRIVSVGTQTSADGINMLNAAQLRDLNVVNVAD